MARWVLTLTLQKQHKIVAIACCIITITPHTSAEKQELRKKENSA
jgi:hypothetical protein